MIFETQMTPMNIQILQSVLYNIEKDITSIKLTIDFDNEQKYKKFISRYQPIANEDEDVLESSGSQDQQKYLSDDALLDIDVEGGPKEQCYVEKLSRLQLSIILKQNYQQKIQQIGKSLGVRILIVPEKIKYFGQTQNIQQARSQIHDLKTNINPNIQISTKQIYQSKYYRQKLLKVGVKMGKLGQKYYYWYNSQQCDQKQVDSLLQEILHKNVHIFFPLLQNYQNLRRRFNTKYINALIKNNAKLYKQFLQKQVNDDKNYHKVELSQSNLELIIHVPVSQQAQIIKYQIKKYFSNLIQFFIHYKIDQDAQNKQIQNQEQIQKLLQQKQMLWTRHEDLIVISFNKDNKNMDNQTITNDLTTYIQNKQKQFLQNLKQVFQVNTNCSIQFIGEKQQILMQGDQKFDVLSKKIITLYKTYDGIIVIAPKSQRAELLQQIVQQFILKPVLFPKIKQKKQDQTNSLISSNNQISLINDTTSIIEPSNTSTILGDSILKDDKKQQNAQNLQQNNSNLLLTQIKQNPVFKNYDFYFKDIYGQQKYYEDSDEIKKGKKFFSKERSAFEDLFEEATKIKYELYAISLPERFKRQKQLSEDNYVTVFVKDKDKQYLGTDKTYVYLMIRGSKHITTNGWLLNVNKTDIKQLQYRYEVQKGKYQIIMYIKYIEGG